MSTLQPLNARWHHGTFIAECQLGDSGGGHGVSSKERHGDAIVHFLIDQQGHIVAAFKSSEDRLGPLRAFRIEFAIQRVPSLLHQPIKKWIVGATVNQMYGQTTSRAC